uniref:Uncharacterized protein n=1 Tax=Rhizophora mucronata TaxID=61149 RepID=A0A2P2PP80_RHIMU
MMFDQCLYDWDFRFQTTLESCMFILKCSFTKHTPVWVHYCFRDFLEVKIYFSFQKSNINVLTCLGMLK